MLDTSKCCLLLKPARCYVITTFGDIDGTSELDILKHQKPLKFSRACFEIFVDTVESNDFLIHL